MATSRVPASWLYLQNASEQTLQAFELSRLNLASCLRKQIETLVIQYLDEVAAAMLARHLYRRSQESSCLRSPHGDGFSRTHSQPDSHGAQGRAVAPIARAERSLPLSRLQCR
jgi:hypothetical protein